MHLSVDLFFFFIIIRLKGLQTIFIRRWEVFYGIYGGRILTLSFFLRQIIFLSPNPIFLENEVSEAGLNTQISLAKPHGLIVNVKHRVKSSS